MTWVYFLLFADVDRWESPVYDAQYPFSRRRCICDICHVPLKTGAETLKVIEKQISRIGLTRYDLISGTGDGGGENEGSSGVHALLEWNGAEAYQRRRCFSHLPWRVANAGIEQCGHHRETEAICTYLRDGITWSRLESIATQPEEQGGLGMMEPQSHEARTFFETAPPSLIEDRPECVVVFLKWLLPRHKRLAKLAARDLEQRDLEIRAAPIALTSLRETTHFLRRHVDMIMVSKAARLSLSMRIIWVGVFKSNRSALSCPASKAARLSLYLCVLFWLVF